MREAAHDPETIHDAPAGLIGKAQRWDGKKCEVTLSSHQQGTLDKPIGSGKYLAGV